MYQHFNISTDIIFGNGTLANFQLPAGDLLFVSSASLDEVTFNSIENLFSHHDGSITRIIKPSGEPSSEDIDEVFSGLPKFASVFSVGGGSTLDFAKSLALLGGSGGRIADYEFGDRVVSKVKPLYLVPTTCGTGSEVTPFAVINNSNTGRKFTLYHPDLRAAQAVIDPSLLVGLPDHIILPTALDAFSHCLEALLTRGNTQLIWPIAIHGLQIAWRQLKPESRARGGLDYFQELALLSLFGGIAIAHSRTGLIHTLSVAFAQYTKTPHGLLNSLLLPFAIRHNLEGYDGLLCRVVESTSGELLKDDHEAYEVLVSWLQDIVGDDLRLPLSCMAEHKEALISRISQDKGLPAICHGDVSEAGLGRLLEEIYRA